MGGDADPVCRRLAWNGADTAFGKIAYRHHKEKGLATKLLAANPDIHWCRIVDTQLRALIQPMMMNEEWRGTLRICDVELTANSGEIFFIIIVVVELGL